MSNWKKIITSASFADLNRLDTGYTRIRGEYLNTTVTVGANILPNLSFTLNDDFRAESAFVGNSVGENIIGTGVTGVTTSDISNLFDNDTSTICSFTSTLAAGTNIYLYFTLDVPTALRGFFTEYSAANVVPSTFTIQYSDTTPVPGEVTDWHDFGTNDIGGDIVLTSINQDLGPSVTSKYWRLVLNTDHTGTSGLVAIDQLQAFIPSFTNTEITPNYQLEVTGSTHIRERLKVGDDVDVASDDGAGTIIAYGSGVNGNIVIQTDNNNNDAGISFRNSGGAYTHRIYRTNITSNEADLVIAGGAANSTITALDNFIVIKGGDAAFESTVIGESPGDVNLIGDLSSSATSTASFGTYIGDGSQLSNIAGSGVFAVGFDLTDSTDVVNIQHNLDSEFVSITVYTGSIAEGNKRQIIPREARVISSEEIRLEFDRPTTGDVIIHRGGNIVSGSAFSYREAVSGADTYDIDHNLGESYPIVQFYLPTKVQMIPKSVESLNGNTIRIEFDEDTDGTVVVKR